MKIFITYASAGAGHQKAAEAIFEAFNRIRKPNVDVRLINSLDYSTKLFRFSYLRTYLLLSQKLPLLWGIGYYILDFGPLYNSILKYIRRFTNGINNGMFVKFIMQEKPDVVVTTHFLATEVISNLKRHNKFNGKLVTVVTDFGLHSFWVEKEVDRYAVASEDTKADLVKRGADKDKIDILGIPILKSFSLRQPQNIMRESLGLRSDLFTILLVGGGFGTGPIYKIVRILAEMDYPIQTIIVCGKNPALYNKVKRYAKTIKMPTLIYEFATNMPELMNASDLAITKPGGISSSEAFAMLLPLMVISPIPGQESKNAKFLERRNAGLVVKNISEFKKEFAGLFHSPHRLLQMKERIKKIARPNSSQDIAYMVLNKYAA